MVVPDGWSLDDKRTPLLPEDKLGPVPQALRSLGEGGPASLTADDHAKNNLPDILARWRTLHPLSPTGEMPTSGARRNTMECKIPSPVPLPARERVGVRAASMRAPGKSEGAGNGELSRPRTAQSSCVPKADIAAQGYDLSLSRYKEVVHDEIEHRPPKEILAELTKLEEEIQRGMKELEGMLK